MQTPTIMTPPLLKANRHPFECPIELLERWVKINSESHNHAGVLTMQEEVSFELEALGFEVKWLHPENDSTGLPLVVGTIPGIVAEGINFICHSDTVHHSLDMPHELQKNGDYAVGPGVVDNKGGIITALLGIKNYLESLKKENKEPYYTLRFLCSPSEELGSPGLHRYFKEFTHDGFMALGFEPANEEGDIIESRKGNRWYNIQVTGHEAHAGRNHDKGVNAALELSQKLVELNQLTDYEKKITVSIGHLQTEKNKYNIVCGKASAKIDLRFADLKTRDEAELKIQGILATSELYNRDKSKTTEIKYWVEDDCPPFSKGQKSKYYLDLYKNLISDLEKRKIKSIAVGGAADSNYLNDYHMAIIDGLGPIGHGMHTKEETIYLPSLQSRSLALTRFLQKISQENYQ